MRRLGVRRSAAEQVAADCAADLEQLDRQRRAEAEAWRVAQAVRPRPYDHEAET